MSEKLTLDAFGKAVDEFLTENHVVLMVDMPEGTEEATVKSNVHAGTIELYVLLAALEVTVEKLLDEMGRETVDLPGLLDGILSLVKEDILLAVSEKEGGGKDA